jgi:hypothetical protein
MPGALRPTLLWVHATRAAVPAVDQAFVDAFHGGWCSYIGSRRGELVTRVEVAADAIAGLKNATLLP